MFKAEASKSAAIRARLNHPVIDADGHIIEFEPALLDHLTDVGGRSLAERFTAWGKESLFRWHRAAPDERHDRRIPRLTWWGMPARNTLDRATASLPGLFYERLDEIGIDFSILYPTFGLPVAHIEDEELRRGVCRAFNHFYAETFRDFAGRLCPVAIIPMHTPEEAIEELDHAVKDLGLKAVMCAGFVRRPIAAVARECPAASRDAVWIDTFGLDSEYDYDPFWARCVELKINPAFHSSGFGWGARTSPSNYIYNHLGMFAAAGEALCKSLFLGGVTRRFPGLKFAFLEGGVAWACSLYSDLFGHWEKRNRKSLEDLNPANLDLDLLAKLYREYGGNMVEGRLDQIDRVLGLLNSTREDPAMLDEWAACKIERPEDIRDLFVPSFYFGCEADDPMNALAFDTKLNPYGARLRVLFGSDISHWDVPDVREVVEEVYEMVEKGMITEEDMKDFVFTNPVSFFAGANRDFFKGTVVEQETEKLLAEGIQV
ncbi:MAG TPA: amidohydrolase family protein [Blastocatellia bacterium]|nr:amidohydrolase family protein [Blastocatellia bacterium]